MRNSSMKIMSTEISRGLQNRFAAAIAAGIFAALAIAMVGWWLYFAPNIKNYGSSRFCVGSLVRIS